MIACSLSKADHHERIKTVQTSGSGPDEKNSEWTGESFSIVDIPVVNFASCGMNYTAAFRRCHVANGAAGIGRAFSLDFRDFEGPPG